MQCEECGKEADAPLCNGCLNAYFDEYEKDTLYGGEHGEELPQPVLGLEAQTA